MFNRKQSVYKRKPIQQIIIFQHNKKNNKSRTFDSTEFVDINFV